jgi:hypothetical protein
MGMVAMIRRMADPQRNTVKNLCPDRRCVRIFFLFF